MVSCEETERGERLLTFCAKMTPKRMPKRRVKLKKQRGDTLKIPIYLWDIPRKIGRFKNFNFWFLYFLTFFNTHQKTLPGKFWNLCCFTKILFRKKNTKKLFKVFLYALFEFENFNLVLETVGIYSSIFFWKFFYYFKLLFILQILRPGWCLW